MNRDKLIELIRFTASEIEPKEISIECAESILVDFEKQCDIQGVSFSLFDKVYMDSPFGRYTGVVKGVEKSRVVIESYSPMGNGMMLADYDLTNNDWQKY